MLQLLRHQVKINGSWQGRHEEKYEGGISAMLHTDHPVKDSLHFSEQREIGYPCKGHADHFGFPQKKIS